MFRTAAVIFIIIVLLPGLLAAQDRQTDIRQQKLLLNLAWGFLYVVRQNQVDKDSTLSASSRQLKIDRLILITQNGEAPFYSGKTFTSSKEELRFLKTQVSKYTGDENTRLLNSIGWMYIFEQGGLKANLDSARRYLEQAKEQSEKLEDTKGHTDNLSYFGLYFYKKGELKAGDSCLQMAIIQCRKSGNKSGEALALEYKAIYYPFGLCPFDVRIACLKKALELYRQLNDKEAQAITLINTAYFFFVSGKLAECKKLTLESLQLQKDIGFPFTHYTTDLLALISIVEGNNGNFLLYALQSIRTMEATNDSTGRAYFYARAGDAYAEVDNKTEESVNWYVKALHEFEKSGGDRSMYKLLVNLAIKMEKLGRNREIISLGEGLMKRFPPVNAMDKQNLLMALAGAYFKIGQTVTSGKYYEQAEKLEPAVKAISGDINTGYIYFSIGFFYFDTKQYEKSRPYFMKIMKGDFPAGLSLVALNNINLALFTIDSAAGNLNAAIKHLREYSRLNDSIYSEKQSKQIHEWDILYNTEKKEKDLQLLTKENQVKALSLKKATLTRNIIIASAVLLVALLFTGYSLKQQHNKKLQSQQKEINTQNELLKESLADQLKLVEEKEWLVKEIHHRVKNNLQMIISLLNAQSEFLDHPSAINAIKESRERMQAVALIHQKLYQPHQGTSLNMLAYIQEMVNYLGSSFADADRIKFKLDVQDISLDVSQAVPLGLVLNEAITNVVKYAFQPHEQGTLNIALHYLNTDDILLQVKDNGRGLPDDFDVLNSNSLGMQLMQLFAEQLDGTIRFSNSDGLELLLTFKQFKSEQINRYLINTDITDGKNFNR